MTVSAHAHEHGRHEGHAHGVSADADSRKLAVALALILALMLLEVAAGLVAGSLALLSDAGHMLTDAAAISFSLVAIRLAARPPEGVMTYGLKRVEILSAQANGVTLLVLGLLIGFEGVRRLIDPPGVEGGVVLAVALVGVVVNLAATWTLARANRRSLNVEGSFQHILTDLYAFIATAVAGGVVLWTGWLRADALASLLIAALMLRAAYGLLRDSGRIFLEAAPTGLDRRDRPLARRAIVRRRGARSARVGDLVRLPGTHRACPRHTRLRLPRDAPAARRAPRGALRHRPHDAAGRPRPAAAPDRDARRGHRQAEGH